MTTYFEPENSNLMPEYGGAAILTGRGSAELAPHALFTRYVVKELGWLDEGSNGISRLGDASGTLYYAMDDALYTSISSYLTAAQLATVTTTTPSGFSFVSTEANLMPQPNRKNWVIIGDSISVCQGATTPLQDHPLCSVINDMSGETLVFSDNDRKAVSASYCVLNIAISSSAFDGVDVYPENWADAYNQHIETLPEPAEGFDFLIALGSNDASHDGTVTGSDIWTRALALKTLIAADFPNSRIHFQTLIKRTEGATLNGVLDDYNVLLRANYASNGINLVLDIEDDVDELNISLGDTTNTTYYPDQVHPTTAAYNLMKPSVSSLVTAAEAI